MGISTKQSLHLISLLNQSNETYNCFPSFHVFILFNQ